MKKTYFKSLFATVCLLCSTNASAYDFEVDGIYYDVVSLSEFTCTVVKEDSNKYYTGDITIPATVNYANRTLTVVKIGENVFTNSSDLTSIVIPNTISYIGNCMFNGCKKLECVTIEDGNTILELGYNTKRNYDNGDDGKGLFYDCPIKTLYLGRDLSYEPGLTYGFSPFYSINTMTKLTIGNSVTIIGNYAFFGCSGLTNVTISHSLTMISFSAFAGCSGLTSITIPNSVITIEPDAFAYCT